MYCSGLLDIIIDNGYCYHSGIVLVRMINVNRSTWLRVYAHHWASLKDEFWDFAYSCGCKNFA